MGPSVKSGSVISARIGSLIDASSQVTQVPLHLTLLSEKRPSSSLQLPFSSPLRSVFRVPVPCSFLFLPTSLGRQSGGHVGGLIIPKDADQGANLTETEDRPKVRTGEGREVVKRGKTENVESLFLESGWKVRHKRKQPSASTRSKMQSWIELVCSFGDSGFSLSMR